jgi:murein DD-endopeptidase MepM/ murein hydrolase activator NlpD
MRRRDPLVRLFATTSVFILFGIKTFTALLLILIGGISFLKTQQGYLENPFSNKTDQNAAQIGGVKQPASQATPDTEWSRALSTLVQQQSTAFTPMPPVDANPAQPTPDGPVLQPLANNPVVQIPTPVSNPVASQQLISSPLSGISIADLPATISQEFVAPPTGEDTGHHGVDFAFWRRGDQVSILGVPITSVFSGKVASAFNQVRPPYGYVTIIETPLSTLPQTIINAIKLPALAVPVGKSDKLSCPEGFTDQWNTESKSLYLLYGHMNKPPAVTLGQSVNAGDMIGEVGNTGASSAPHLHLEMRIGPSNATFESLGHYDPSTSDQERHNYCTWRISGVFQMFNPMTLLTVQ